MKLKRMLSSLLLSMMLLVQAPVAALAAETDTVAASPSPSATASPSPSPSASPDPEPELPPKPGYVYNDSTAKWQEANLGSFTWDAGLGRWVSPLYWYDSQVGWYHITAAPTLSVSPEPTPLAPASTTLDNSGISSGDGANATTATGASNSNTGPGSTNSAAINNANTLLANATSLANITNTAFSTALSGSANVSTNTSAGNATTGAASVVANYLNLLSSMWSWGTGGLSTFILDIWGNHVGDINIDIPGASGGGGVLGSCGGASNSTTGPLSLNTASSSCSNTTTGNNSTKGSIVNNINLNAESGAANVENNTSGGNAVSGDATASLNIINMINSSIGAGRSFFGMINIYGSLDGDILFPGLSLDDAIAGSASGSANNASTGAGSTNNAALTNSNDGTVNNSATGAFNNNIDANAESGAANVANNTSAGTATSGSAGTNTNTFNLFNMDIFGDNAVLVLINNMGTWVGRIMNLPGGESGGALLTSNATVSNSNTGAGSVNNATSNNSNSGTINNSASGTITNNVNANAQSGDANVQNNTNAGSARSGDARVATNIANIFGSTLRFGKVFGILIVNVFGSWNGSVGVDTAAGNRPGSVSALDTGAQLALAMNPASWLAASMNSGITNLTANIGHNGASNGSTTEANYGSNASGSRVDPTLVASANTQAAANDHATAAAQASSGGWLVVFAVTLLTAGALLSLDRRLRRRNS